MLVLSRKIGEVIWIGDTIKVTICDVQNGKVRVGISAPRDTPIMREELLNHEPRKAGSNATGTNGGE